MQFLPAFFVKLTIFLLRPAHYMLNSNKLNPQRVLKINQVLFAPKGNIFLVTCLCSEENVGYLIHQSINQAYSNISH